MGLFNDFKESLGTTGKGLGMVVGGSAKLAGTVGKAALQGVKVVAKGAVEFVLSSNENSELDYRYDDAEWCYADDGRTCTPTDNVREILGRAFIDLALRRPWDSYVRFILSHCIGCNLDERTAKLLSRADFRRLCAKGELSEVEKYSENAGFSESEIKNAIEVYNKAIKKSSYCDFIRVAYVSSVGENIEEFVRDDDGEYIRDGEGGYVKETVGRDDGVARFNVTFSSGHRIKMKIRWINGWGFGSLTPHTDI